MKYHLLYMASIIAWIEESLYDGLTLGKIASFAKGSPYHFTRVFREYCGLTVMEYVRQRTLLHAAQYMSSGTKISEVASTFGYRNTSAFARAFRRFCGQAPSEYQNLLSTMGSSAESNRTEVKKISNHATLRLAYDLADYELILSSQGYTPHKLSYYVSQLKAGSPFLLYVESGGQIAGVTFGAPRDSCQVTIAFVVVDRKCRKQGIGRALMMEMFRTLESQAYKNLVVETMATAEGFFAKCGMSPAISIHSKKRSLEELRSFNDEYVEIMGHESNENGWSELVLDTPTKVNSLRQKYGELYRDCITRVAFHKRF